jgi:GTP-binding protein EngB required for normal cell division
MTTDPHDLIRDFAEQCRRRMKEFEETTVKCGIIGPAGSGKSSLINAIAGEKIASTGYVETTNEPLEFIHQGLIFVDLPGLGTKKWPKDSYIDRLNLLTFDFFILVTEGRFTENDIYLYRELKGRGKACYLIRNKFDISITAGHRDHGHTEEEIRKVIENNIRENLPDLDDEKIYLTSAWYPKKYDLKILLNDIAVALKGIKSKRFIADMGAYSDDALKKKREVALGLLPYYAGASAANGLNPIPGLDIAADITILVKYAHEVSSIYGLNSEQMEYYKRLLGPDKIPALVAKVAQFAAKYLAKEGIILVLKRVATRQVVKSVAKWVPFVGPLISSGLGWQSTFMLGEDLVNEAQTLAKEILDSIIQDPLSQDRDI